MTHRDGKTTKFGYDAAGRRVTLVRGNATRADADYNANGFLSLLNGPGASTSFGYELAPSGKRLGITSGGQTTSYGYDNAGRLLSESSPALPSIAYTLDAVGNRQTSTNFAYTYNANDWLQKVVGGGQTTNYGYDANGALTTVNSTAVNAYDFEGHLVTSGATHFTYDADGNRLSQTTSAGQTFYLQDTSSGLVEVVEEYDGGGALQARYDYAGSELIRQDRNGSTWYTHLDGLGSVCALSDANGAIVATYTYDAFGNVVAGGGGAAASNPYRYAGAAFDSATGLYYLRARYYDPQAGRFLSQDLYAGTTDDPVTLHRYLYAAVDPVNRIDPTGMYDQWEGTSVERAIQPKYTAEHAGDKVDFGKEQYYDAKGWLGKKSQPDGTPLRKPDIFNRTNFTYMEIKPFSLSGVRDGASAMRANAGALGPKSPPYPGANPHGAFLPDLQWKSPLSVLADNGKIYHLFDVDGVIYYTSFVKEIAELLEIRALLSAASGVEVVETVGVDAGLTTAASTAEAAGEIQTLTTVGVEAGVVDVEAEVPLDTLETVEAGA